MAGAVMAAAIMVAATMVAATMVVVTLVVVTLAAAIMVATGDILRVRSMAGLMGGKITAAIMRRRRSIGANTVRRIVIE